MKTCLELQTINTAYQEITHGEIPWIALGNFMNDFFDNFADRREELVRDPIEVPSNPTAEIWQWAVFCSGAVEYLCQKYAVPCPAWALDPIYTLADPWFHSPAAHKPTVRERITRETPETFSRRNVYCGNRVFLNKHEAAERFQRLSA